MNHSNRKDQMYKYKHKLEYFNDDDNSQMVDN